MKKYKLIKEYPGSPKLNYILKPIKNNKQEYYINNMFINPEDYPEYWEEIIEKDYEILSFIVDSNKVILTRRQNNLFASVRSNVTNGFYSEEDILSNDPKRVDWIENSDDKYGYSIYSVRRLSDGEIFTIGDKTNQGVINNILLVDNNILFNQYVNSFKNIQHVKQPLFTTEDGVEMFAGQIICSVHIETHTIQDRGLLCLDFKPNNDYKYFSKREKAEEYIKLNSIRYSLKDIKEAFGESRTLSFKSIFNKLKQ